MFYYHHLPIVLSLSLSIRLLISLSICIFSSSVYPSVSLSFRPSVCRTKQDLQLPSITVQVVGMSLTVFRGQMFHRELTYNYRFLIGSSTLFDLPRPRSKCHQHLALTPPIENDFSNVVNAFRRRLATRGSSITCQVAPCRRCVMFRSGHFPTEAESRLTWIPSSR